MTMLSEQPFVLSINSLTKDERLKSFITEQVAAIARDLDIVPTDDPEVNADNRATLKQALIEKMSDLEGFSGKTWRLTIIDSAYTGDWKLARQTLIDPVTGQAELSESGEILTRKFSDLEEWLQAVTFGKQDSVRSALRATINVLVPAIVEGAVLNPKNGKPYKLAEILQMPARNLDYMATKANMLNASGKIEELGQYMPTALTRPREEIQKLFNATGGSGGGVDTIQIHRAFLEDGKQVATVLLTDRQYKMMAALLGDRVAWLSDTKDGLVDMLEGTTHETEDDTSIEASAGISNGADLQDNHEPGQERSQWPLSYVQFIDSSAGERGNEAGKPR